MMQNLNYRERLSAGMAIGFGLDPVYADTSDGFIYGLKGYGKTLEFGRDAAGQSVISRVASNSGQFEFGMGQAGYLGLQTFGLGFSAIGGYAEGGVLGAGRAILQDFAIDEAVANANARKAYNKFGRSMSMFDIKSSTLGKFGRYAGAYASSSIAMGAFTSVIGGGVAGSLGSVPVASSAARFGARNPLLTVGAVTTMAVGGLAAKAGGAILNEGYRYKQMKRQIHTDGDLSAFMSSNAHTMRSRAVQAVQRMGHNARSALGQEARFIGSHYRNYNSRYYNAY